MTQQMSSDHMADVRRSLAEAGIYFDKLYINQAYFNSHITVNEPPKKHPKPNHTYWQRLLCASSESLYPFYGQRRTIVVFRNQTNCDSQSNK